MRISYWSSDVCSSDLAPCRSFVGLCSQSLVATPAAEMAGLRKIWTARTAAPVFPHAGRCDPETLIVKSNPPRRRSLGIWKSAMSRSEEHTSELQSLMRISYAVFCLKKKNIKIQHIHKSLTT